MLIVLLQNIIESKYHYQPSWVMVIIALSVMILGYLFSAFHTRFNEFLKASLTIRSVNQLSREEYSLSHPTSIFLSVNFIITTSLFILQVISSKKVLSSFVDFSFLSYLIVVGFVFLVYFIKTIALKIVGYIFDKSAEINEYVFIIFLINQIIGIGFIPIVIFIAYGQQSFLGGFVYTGFALIISAFVFRIGKGVTMVFSSREISVFYLFLYLCTLEILPLLLGMKLFEKPA